MEPEFEMRTWLRRIRGGVGMGMTWAIGWALVGMLIELITEFVPGWNGALIDIWPAALGLLGFLGGGTFSVVLGIAGGRRRFDEISLPRFAALGALGGLLASAFILTAAGVSVETLVAAGAVTLLCPGSAAGSLALARRVEDRDLLNAGADVAGVRLANE